MSWLLSALVTTKVATLVGLFLLARYLGQGLFGRYAVALAIPAGLEAFADLGISWALVREGAGAPEAARRYAYAALPVKVALSLLLVLLTYGLAVGLSLPQEVIEAAVWLAVARAFDSLTYLCRAVFQANEVMQFDAAAQSFDGLIRLTFIGYSLFSGFGLIGIAKALAVAALITLAATVTFAWRRFLRPIEVQLGLVPVLLAAGLPLGAIWLLDSLVLRVGTILTEYRLGDAAAGNLAAAMRLIEPLLTVPAVMATALLPLTARHVAEGRDTVPRLVSGSFKVALLLGAAAGVALFGAGSTAVAWIFGDGFALAQELIRVLALTLPVLFIHGLLLGFLVALRSQRALIVSQAVGLLVNLTISLLLFSRIGAVAAPVGLFCGEVTMIAFAFRIVPQLRALGLGPVLLVIAAAVPASVVVVVGGGLGEIPITVLALLVLVVTIRVSGVVERHELDYLQGAAPRLTWLSHLLLEPMR